MEDKNLYFILIISVIAILAVIYIVYKNSTSKKTLSTMVPRPLL